MNGLHETTRIEFYELAITAENESWIIGRPDTGVYIRTNSVGKEIVDLLQHGCAIVHVERHFPETQVRHFIYELIHDGFVKRIDEHELPDKHRESFRPLFNRIRKEQVSWLFHPVMLLLYLATITVGGFLLVTNPKYLPLPGDVFFTKYLMILLPVSLVASWILIFFHEMGHYLAAKSHGLLTRFGITNRYYYIVAITDVTNVYSLPREQRFRILYGGMVVDALIMSVSIMAMHFLPLPAWIAAFLAFVVLVTFLGLTWQFLFFLRTDLYFVIENIVGIHNLNEKTRLLLKRLVQKHVVIPFENAKEERFTKAYALFFLLGYGVLTFLLLFYSIPVMVEIIGRVFTQLFAVSSRAAFLDAVMFLFITLVNQVVFGMVIISHRFRKPVAKLVAMTLLLIAEFLLAFLLMTAAVVTTQSLVLVGFLSFLIGMAFPWPVFFLWRKSHPDSLLKRELTLILIVVFIAYTFVFNGLLKKFLLAIGSAVPAWALISTLVMGILTTLVYLYGEHR